MTMQASAKELVVIRSSVRKLCDRYGHEYYVKTSLEGGNARELWRELGALGMLGLTIPEEYGGGGQGLEALIVVAEEAAAAGIPLMVILASSMCATMLTDFGSDSQRSKWLPGLADGSTVLGFAITEPDAGSNAHNIRTKAMFDDGEWVISGQKHYISHVDNSAALVVIADAAGGPGQLPQGLKAFIVPVDAKGLSASKIDVEILSPERQYSLFFDNVRVPADAIVGGSHGMGVLFTGLNPERILTAALMNGVARYAIDKAVAYANQRSVWGVPIGSHQAVAHPLARAQVALTGSRLITEVAAQAYDRGETGGVLAAMAKVAATESASGALDASIQTHGGNGMSREYGLSTLTGLVRLFRIAPVSSEMLLNHIAYKGLSLPRSYG